MAVRGRTLLVAGAQRKCGVCPAGPTVVVIIGLAISGPNVASRVRSFDGKVAHRRLMAAQGMNRCIGAQ